MQMALTSRSAIGYVAGRINPDSFHARCRAPAILIDCRPRLSRMTAALTLSCPAVPACPSSSTVSMRSTPSSKAVRPRARLEVQLTIYGGRYIGERQPERCRPLLSDHGPASRLWTARGRAAREPQIAKTRRELSPELGRAIRAAPGPRWMCRPIRRPSIVAPLIDVDPRQRPSAMLHAGDPGRPPR